MNNEIDKYFRRELTPEEETKLLQKIASDSELQEEFAKQQRMEALLSFSGFTKKENANQKYKSFRQKAGKKKTQHFIFGRRGIVDRP
ncbi:MAG: hypothetical protein LUH10_16890 [Tannerellaceae bacterium]|nr:hypothetical protein [Tannerellaceae bacterium]